MTFKLVSSKRILAKVLADLDLSEKDLKVTDMQEWCGEAVEKIGAVTQLLPKVGGHDGAPILELRDHQASLPCDLHQLHQVAYSFRECGPWFPMRKSTGAFSIWGESEPCNCIDCKKCGCCGKCDHCHNCKECKKPDILIQDKIIIDLFVDMIGNIDKREAMDILQKNENAMTIMRNLVGSHTNHHHIAERRLNGSFGLQYNVKPGYIMCNVPCGFLKLSYNAIPIDEDGYPMVPDLASYQEAVYWYIAMKYLYPKRLRNEIARDDYYDIRRSWNFYRKQAYAELIMPNQDEMESIKNDWNKLWPEINDHSGFYSHTGERQIYYNH